MTRASAVRPEAPEDADMYDESLRLHHAILHYPIQDPNTRYCPMLSNNTPPALSSVGSPTSFWPDVLINHHAYPHCWNRYEFRPC